MKITIDLEDFWLEGEQDLESGLKEFVKNSVLSEVKKSIEKKVDDHITMKVKEEVEKSMYEQMNALIAETIEKGTVPSYNDSKKQVTLEEYIKERFISTSGWNNPMDEIKKLANKFGTDMKARYDLLFASQLVAKMNETGLLKKDAARFLLEKTT